MMRGGTIASCALSFLATIVFLFVLFLARAWFTPLALPIPKPPDPRPGISSAAGSASSVAACSDAAPLVIEASKHLVAYGVARLSAWTALKLCPELETYYCPRGAYADNPKEDYFMVVCRDVNGVYCAVGIISNRVDPARPNVRTAITAWVSPCTSFESRRARQGCERVWSIRFAWR